MSEELLAHLCARVDELEMRLAFQEDTLGELNGVIAQQDAALMKLTARLQNLGEKHQDLQYRLDQSGEMPADERPPHY